VLEGLRVERLDWGGQVSRRYVSGNNNIARQLAWLLAARRYLKRHHREYDVIHAHVQASLVAGILGTSPKKLVWSWHGSYHRQLYQMFPIHQAWFYEIAEHIAIRLPYAACVTADKYTKQLAVDHMRARSDRIIPIANGVDVRMFQPRPLAKPSEWPAGFHIVSTRRQVPKDGLQFLIPSLQPIVRRRPDVHLMLFGDGPLRPKLEHIASEQGLMKNVHFMGALPFTSMPDVYNAADMAAVPSLYEATSLACLEAMACEKLLLTCPVGGIPEIAPPELVLYAQPGDVVSLTGRLEHAIFEMSEDQRRDQGRRCRQHVAEHFTWEKTVDRVLDVYGHVLGLN
jgi:glycosyltransferase involved in cell wall biosynthesis